MVQAMRRGPLTGVLGLCLLGIPLMRLAATRIPVSPFPLRSTLITLGSPHTPSEAARRAGWHCWCQARLAVNREREALEAWDPEALAGESQEPWRRQTMARDRTGNLHRAVAHARAAATLARTAEESYRAAQLLALLEHEAGHHQAELQQAQVLMALARRNPVSRAYLQRAVQCNWPEP